MRRLPFALVLATTNAAADADPAAERRGLALYQAGKYAEAAVELEQAYVDAPSPRIGFALAQSLRLAGNCERALVFYRRVAEKVPDEAKPKLREAMAPCEQAEREAAAREASEREARPPDVRPTGVAATGAPRPHEPAAPWYRDVVGGALVVGGSIGLGFGGYALTRARGHYHDADEATSDRAFTDARSAGDRWRRYAIVSGAVGSALVIGGIVRYVLVSRRDGAAPATTAIIAPTRDGAIVAGVWAW